MSASLSSDLKRLKSLAFQREAWGSELIQKLHTIPESFKDHPDFHLLQKLRLWLLAPLSLWPSNLDEIGHRAINAILEGKRLEHEVLLVLNFLDEPSREAQNLVAEHERCLERGRHESFVHANHKFTFKEQELENREDLKDEWKTIKSFSDIKKFQDSKGFIRRRFIHDVQNTVDWKINWNDEGDRFYAVFNTFCYRWNLYGMEHDRPILLRMTIEINAYGTIVFIPSYWSLDPYRDLKWRIITAIHRTRSVSKQGLKLGMNQIARREEAIRARLLIEEAKNKGFKGLERTYWVMGQLGWDVRTDPIRLRRLMKLAP
jgi:hypothetical protein